MSFDAGRAVQELLRGIQDGKLEGHSPPDIPTDKMQLFKEAVFGCATVDDSYAAYRNFVHQMQTSPNDYPANSFRRVSPSIVAALLGSKELVEPLLAVQAHIPNQGQMEYTPLHVACFMGRVEIVEALLRHLPDTVGVKSRTKGWLPLHFAAKCGHAKIIELLGAQEGWRDSVNLLTTDHKCALSLAALSTNNALEAVRSLVDTGADVNLTFGVSKRTLLGAELVKDNRKPSGIVKYLFSLPSLDITSCHTPPVSRGEYAGLSTPAEIITRKIEMLEGQSVTEDAATALYEWRVILDLLQKRGGPGVAVLQGGLVPADHFPKSFTSQREYLAFLNTEYVQPQKENLPLRNVLRSGEKRMKVGKIRAFGLWIRNVMAVHSSSRVAKLPHEQRIPLKSVEYSRFFKNHQLHELFPDGWPYVADKKYFKAALDLAQRDVPDQENNMLITDWIAGGGSN